MHNILTAYTSLYTDATPIPVVALIPCLREGKPTFGLPLFALRLAPHNPNALLLRCLVLYVVSGRAPSSILVAASIAYFFNKACDHGYYALVGTA